MYCYHNLTLFIIQIPFSTSLTRSLSKILYLKEFRTQSPNKLNIAFCMVARIKSEYTNLLSSLCVGNLGKKAANSAATAVGVVLSVARPPPRNNSPIVQWTAIWNINSHIYPVSGHGYYPYPITCSSLIKFLRRLV